ncbi:MAG: hypothetical protein ACSW8J_01360, partial [bacterium]
MEPGQTVALVGPSGGGKTTAPEETSQKRGIRLAA